MDRSSWLFLAMVLAVSVTGYFIGIRERARYVVPEEPQPVEREAGQPPQAVRYAEGPRRHLGPNRDWQARLASLESSPPPVPQQPADAEAVAAALNARDDLRAFRGAPPQIPHPIDQRSAASCLACHQDGKVIGDRIARPMSHQLFTSCTQCHVPAGHPVLGERPGMPATHFVGLEERRGERFGPGSPPTLPHPVWMRSDCRSCHGPFGPEALRTTHPERQSCLQCHAPSAELDQRQFLPPGPGGW